MPNNVKINKPNNNGTSNKTNLQPQKPNNPTITQELLNQIIITNRIIAKELKEIKEIQAQLLNEIKSIRYRLSIYNNKNKKVISVAELIEKLLAIFDEEAIEKDKKETKTQVKQVNKEEVEDIEEIQETVETQEETEEEDEAIIIDDL